MKFFTLKTSKLAWQIFAASYAVLFAVCGSAYVFGGDSQWIARALEVFFANTITLGFYTAIVLWHEQRE